MREYLQELSKKILSSEEKQKKIPQQDLESFKSDVLVILPAGGEGTRARALTEDKEINKAIFSVTGGISLIESIICMYRDAGLQNFLCLTYFRSNSVRERLGDGSRLGVTISYSEDPGYPAGRGGAILNALETGALPKDKTGIVHNPDDIIYIPKRSFPEMLLNAHLRGIAKNAQATVVLVPGTPYTYTGMSVSKGFITEICMYPMIPVPAHVGVTTLDPSCWSLFENMVEKGKKVDFETNILPQLAKEDKLYACVIPYGSWFPVNDLKYKE